MLQLLIANVGRDLGKLSESHRAKVVALIPTQTFMGGMAVAVGETRAGTLETLNQTRGVIDRWELEEEVDVIAHDPDLDDSGAMAFGLGEEERPEKVGHLIRDQW